MIVRWPHHKRRESGEAGCSRCDARSDAELTAHCIGRLLEPIERTAVRNGALDYIDLTWVTVSELACLTVEEIRDRPWYRP